MISPNKKLVIFAALAVFTFTLVNYITSEIIFLNDYKELEKKNAYQNVNRVLSALEDEIYDLSSLTHDWAM